MAVSLLVVTHENVGLCRGGHGERSHLLFHETLARAGWSQGKTFIVANVIQEASLPTLVLAPNKVSRSFHGRQAVE